jgi:hypothetical protein
MDAMSEEIEPNGAEQPPRKRPALVFDDPLSGRSSDDTDAGWGAAESGRDEAWYRRETPPHHGG